MVETKGLENMSKRIVAVVSIAVLFLLVSSLLVGVTSAGSLSVEVGSEEMVITTEYAGVESNPDVVKLKSDFLEAWVVPNRGLLLYKLLHRPTGTSVLYYTPTPSPYKGEMGRYTFEFGGEYLLTPWNERDWQPMIQEYEIEEETADSLKVRVTGSSPETGIVANVVVSMSSPGTEIVFHVELTNGGKNPVGFRRVERTVFDASEGRLSLPVEEIRVTESGGDWPSEEGSLEWPQPWVYTKDMKGYGKFVAETPEFGISHGSFKVTKRVDFPRDVSTQVTYYEQGYDDYPFSRDILHVETWADEEVSLHPGESIEYDIRFEVEAEVEEPKDRLPQVLVIVGAVVVVVLVIVALARKRVRG